MASYAALVSLNNIINTVQNHPNPPISLDKQQAEALVEKLTFLQQFLELYSDHQTYQADDLESLIRDTCYAAEDVIESYIVDQIDGSTSRVESSNHGDLFYQKLQDVVEEMDAICEKASENKEKMGDVEADQHHMSPMMDASVVSRSLGQKSITVGFDNVLIEILDKLTRQQASRRIIPIIGMGGIGKTTLALKAYEHALVKHHFDIRVWATISQRYNVREILIEVVNHITQDAKETLRDMREDLLGERIHKKLSGMRYLIVMDDMWSTDAWEEVKRFFPDNYNGSRMIVTTRIANVGLQLSGSRDIQLKFLDEEESRDLFCKTVFEKEEYCPLELEEIGKTIAKNCRGLPLSIAVIGGLLAKSNKGKQFWEYVARNLSSIVNLEDDKRCFETLYLSYKHLPIHLKPCFLYMGIFPEDARIRVKWLIEILISEGFLKPIGDENMEAVVENYIAELVDRNLILVDGWAYRGKVIYCKIHDLLRDLCVREAEKDKFLCVVEEDNLNNQCGISTQRRIVVESRASEEEYSPQDLNMQSVPVARSFVWNAGEGISIPPLDFRLVRVLKAVHDVRSWHANIKYSSSVYDAFRFFNSRHLAVTAGSDFEFKFPSSISQLWNLQTLIVFNRDKLITAPIEIWKMPQLKHLKFTRLYLPDPPEDNFVMWNLQTLSRIFDFKCSDEAVKRIPNIRKLGLEYKLSGGHHSEYCLHNLGQLNKIENLSFQIFAEKERASPSNLWHYLTFPRSLKRLYLESSHHHDWEDVTALIGSLPNLENLGLYGINGPEWRPTEGQFSCLKVLTIGSCEELEFWTIDSTHFPLLEHLDLSLLYNLPEIPSRIGEIPTLQSIELWGCSDSCVISAQKIAKEQEEFGNSDFLIDIRLRPRETS